MGSSEAFLSEAGYLIVESGYSIYEVEGVLFKIWEFRIQSILNSPRMQHRKNPIIFYIYLREKFHYIKEELTGSIDHNGKRTNSRVSNILEKLGIAAVTTLLVYGVIVYMNTGSILIRHTEALIELGLAFIFLSTLLFAHSKIAQVVNGVTLSEFNGFGKSVLEIIILIGVTVILFTLTNAIPLYFIFGEEQILPGRIRTAYVSSIIISLFFYYFVERERNRKRLQAEMLRSAQLQRENYKAQLEGLKNQVQPHFLFNSLNVLGALINKDQDQAVEFTQRLSDLYRSLLDYGSEVLIPLKKEVEIAESYAFLLKTRFQNAIQIDIKIEEEFLDLHLPPGSLQMLIENAIKHNGSTSKNPLKINIYTESNYIVVENSLQSRRDKVVSTKTGLNNIKSRYKFVSEQEVLIEKNEYEFIVKLPLIKVEAHESSNN